MFNLKVFFKYISIYVFILGTFSFLAIVVYQVISGSLSGDSDQKQAIYLTAVIFASICTTMLSSLLNNLIPWKEEQRKAIFINLYIIEKRLEDISAKLQCINDNISNEKFNKTLNRIMEMDKELIQMSLDTGIIKLEMSMVLFFRELKDISFLVERDTISKK
ncbi:hypothetical protein ACEOWG_002145 [Bacillus cereus]